MRVCEEFSRCASEYGKYNIIQSEVAQKLIDDTPDVPRRILDLGCGSGTLFSRLNWEVETFCGVDFSASMLAHHPRSAVCELVEGDFNDPTLLERLDASRFDRIYSASALQWAQDIDAVFAALAATGVPLSLAIFTSGTFRTLHRTAGVSALLRSADEVIAAARRHLDASYELRQYTLEFESVREMLRYIKRSGVSGGRRILDYRSTKQLIENYPYRYLEFEVLFITRR